MKQFAQITQKNAPVHMRMQFCVQDAEHRADTYAVVCAVPRAAVLAETCADARAEHRAVIRADRFAERRAVMCADTICRNNCTDAENCAVLRAENPDNDEGADSFSKSFIQFRYFTVPKRKIIVPKSKYRTQGKSSSNKNDVMFTKSRTVQKDVLSE